jgi:DNA-binding NarL/FixJ family response regulator
VTNDIDALIAAMNGEAEVIRQQPDAEATLAAMRNETQVLVTALMRMQGRHRVTSRDPDLMRRVVLLHGILGGYGRSDEAVVIRALAELAGTRREALEAAGQRRRREAEALADRVRSLTGDGLSAAQIAAEVGRSESSIRRIRARAPRP